MNELTNMLKTTGESRGKFTREVEEFMEKEFGMNKVFLTTSGTAALELAAMLCDFNYGDEVIIPSFTFPTTASAFVREGCKPVYTDIKLDTLNMNEDFIEFIITSSTKAIVPIHYAGVGCEMDKIMNIARKYNLLVIEDAAQGFDSYYKGKHLGTIGDIGILSFHATKNIGCGEGGATIINNDRLIEKAEILLEKGTNRNKMFRREIDRYSWVNLGSSFGMSDYLAAILQSKMKNYKDYTSRRKTVYDIYYKLFENFMLTDYVTLPRIPDYCNSNKHIFYTLLKKYKNRDRVLEMLNKSGIKADSHFYPLHLSEYGSQFATGNLHITELVDKSIIRFPMVDSITYDTIATITRMLSNYGV